jgi:hypothetical protein
MNHNSTPACQELLRRVQSGKVVGVLDPVVLGELAYMLTTPRLAPQGRSQRTAAEAAHYLLGVLGWAGIEMEDKQVATVALTAWKAGQADSFVDCYLHTRAAVENERACTDNVRDFPGGVHPADLVGMERARASRQHGRR